MTLSIGLLTRSIFMVDRLAALLDQFSVTAQTFHAGTLCGSHLLAAKGDKGQLHLIRRGPLTVHHGSERLQIDTPSLLLYPRPMDHRFESDARSGADMVCADLLFEGGVNNSIAGALPDVVCLPLEQMPDAATVLQLLFDEAFAQRCGRTTVLNRLFEVVLIQVLRQLMERRLIKGGMLAGLAHPRLRLALVAMHESPARSWSLQELGALCGMSRSVFANGFRDAVGCTPGVYLQNWRIAVAQRLLRQGQSLQQVTDAVGYGSETAFSRAFRARVGMPPRQWREAQRQA
jgi:AraC-like DNA-binding protein